MSKDYVLKIEENKKIIDIVKHILEFNKQNQEGKGLKILNSQVKWSVNYQFL